MIQQFLLSEPPADTSSERISNIIHLSLSPPVPLISPLLLFVGLIDGVSTLSFSLPQSSCRKRYQTGGAMVFLVHRQPVPSPKFRGRLGRRCTTSEAPSDMRDRHVIGREPANAIYGDVQEAGLQLMTITSLDVSHVSGTQRDCVVSSPTRRLNTGINATTSPHSFNFE